MELERRICITPKKCIGCTACALMCSITYQNEFNPNKSYIRILKNDLDGIFHIVLSSLCLNCGKCTEACPSGCLSKTEKEYHSDKEGF